MTVLDVSCPICGARLNPAHYHEPPPVQRRTTFASVVMRLLRRQAIEIAARAGR